MDTSTKSRDGSWQFRMTAWVVMLVAFLTIVVIRYSRRGEIYVLGLLGVIVGVIGVIATYRKRSA